jgi:two-component system, NtrC family, sensor kinase
MKKFKSPEVAMKLSLNQKIDKILPLLTLMNHTNDIDTLLNSILSESERIFSVEGTSILLEDIKTGKLYFYFATGEKGEILKSIQMERGEGICGYVFQTGKALIENDPAQSSLFSDKVDIASEFKTRNLICVPLQIEDKIIGVLELINKIETDFNNEDMDLLKLVGSQISLALQRARLVEEKIRIERLASIGETISGLSHYIKNILTGLQGGSYMINKYMKEISSAKLETGWEIVSSSIERISSLVLDMLYYSKEREPEYELINPKNLAIELIDLYKIKAAEKNIDLQLETEGDLPEVEVDSKSIFRCLVNLISNSLDAFSEKKTGNIRIKMRSIDQQLEISIIDDGAGMTEETQNQLFTKFFSTKGSSGSGIGLPVSKKIIDEHQGKIEVESEFGKGTEFRIYLPLRKPAEKL